MRRATRDHPRREATSERLATVRVRSPRRAWLLTALDGVDYLLPLNGCIGDVLVLPPCVDDGRGAQHGQGASDDRLRVDRVSVHVGDVHCRCNYDGHDCLDTFGLGVHLSSSSPMMVTIFTLSIILLYITVPVPLPPSL